jgi:hypothetical protein
MPLYELYQPELSSGSRGTFRRLRDSKTLERKVNSESVESLDVQLLEWP